jgi:hypothetical protein
VFFRNRFGQHTFLTPLLVLVGLLSTTSAMHASKIAVVIDSSAATTVLNALLNRDLTIEEALKIAQLPGNLGLIRKAQSYGRPANTLLFAQALVAAARQDTTYLDRSEFRFDDVRDRVVETKEVLAALNDPKSNRLVAVEERVAMFTPTELTGTVTAYLVAGGTSGGFAFNDSRFYLNVKRFPSAPLASTVMEHEMYHVVQTLAGAGFVPSMSSLQCLANKPRMADIAGLFDSLSEEGTASYVGDVLALRSDSTDKVVDQERQRVQRNVDMVHRSVTQLELSVHGLATNASVTSADVYELGFYGDEVLYALGYVMARAIVQEQGDSAMGELIAKPGAVFVLRYVHLKAYGKSKLVPALAPESVLWAQQISACFDQK